MLRVDTAGLRAAAKQLRDEAADTVGAAVRATDNTETTYVISLAFDYYGSYQGYKAVSEAWRNELACLAAALRELADAMDASANDYDQADTESSTMLGGGSR